MALPFTFTFAFMKTKRGHSPHSRANTPPHPHLYTSKSSITSSHQYLTSKFQSTSWPQSHIRLDLSPSLPAVHHLSDICRRQEARRRHCHQRLPHKLNRKHCNVTNASTSNILTMSTSQDRDYLTSLPTELLVKVIAKVPIDSYLDLTYTSKGLRDFMKANAAGICNEAIRSRHSIAAEFLKSELKSGWLLPTHKRFGKEDEDYITNLVSYYRLTHVWRGKHYSLLGKLYNNDPNWYPNNLRTPFLTVKSPGPQFLYFLERNILIVCNEHRLPNCCSVRFDETFRRGYEEFLDTFNLLGLEVKNGNIVASGPHPDKIPRAMLWYYGLDKLVLT